MKVAAPFVPVPSVIARFFSVRRLLFVAAVAVTWTGLNSISAQQPKAPATSNTVAQQSADPKTEGEGTLTQQLLAEDAEALAADVAAWGNATRGAILFHQPQLQCAKCHVSAAGATPWGPELTKPEVELSAAELARHVATSVLNPSAKIRKGFETVTVATVDGRILTGVVHQDDENVLVLRDPTNVGKLIELKQADLDERAPGTQSAMPEGLANLLSGRQQFLDLAKYVTEIAAGGPERMRELQPASSLYALPPIPEYENDLDHRMLVANLDQESFKRGRQIYNRVCANCHGTQDREGSLPTSRKFGKEPFKAGADPFSMYQTLTHGFGLMAAQRWMVPRQKYDVIHYVRETYLKRGNPSQYVAVDEAYLDRLPHGAQFGPEPSALDPWSSMDYGPSLTATYEIGEGGGNIAQKGIAMRLDPGPGGVARGRHWMLFEHDTLRMAAGWSGDKFIGWTNVMFDGQHGVHSHVQGDLHFQNPTAPGWANPATGSFEDDVRVVGRDGKRYGPLPQSWAHYRGQYHYGDRVILSYVVGETEILEMPGVDTSQAAPVFMRTFNIGPRPQALRMHVARFPNAEVGFAGTIEGAAEPTQVVSYFPRGADRNEADNLSIAVRPSVAQVKADDESDDLTLEIPAGNEPLRFTLCLAHDRSQAKTLDSLRKIPAAGLDLDLTALMQGGPAHWPEKLTTQVAVRSESADGPFIAENLTHPEANPWLARTRFTGLDFYPDGDRLAICAWDGDVWLVSGVMSSSGQLTWQRIASGLFQPLGVKIVRDQIYVTCRDQLVILNDLNGDGETDFYQNFNSDHQVTEHFHEFAMGLQTDDAGNFYYAKSARHALTAIVPHHGTLLRVSPDGSETKIIANGFRAANGVCINPDGTFFVTDQEGHWTPKNRINLVHEGGFYGNIFGYTDVTDKSDSAMGQPLVWITNAFDRSPAEMLWVPDNAWGPLGGMLLDLSYGYGKVFVVPHESVNGQIQGGLCELPLPQFPTGLCRGRFHPQTGDLYTCGMFAWAGDQTDPGGFYRVRYAGKPVYLPMGLAATETGMRITFSDPVDPAVAARAENYTLKVWGLNRSANYGSPHVNEHEIAVSQAEISADGRTVTLTVPDIAPTRGMEIRYQLQDAAGTAFSGVIHNTIHNLGK